MAKLFRIQELFKIMLNDWAVLESLVQWMNMAKEL